MASRNVFLQAKLNYAHHDSNSSPFQMEVSVQEVVNTGEETFRPGGGATGLINLTLTRWVKLL